MINLFVLQNGRLSQEQVEDRNELLQYSNPIWIDVVDPEEEELQWIKEAFGVSLPELEDLGDLEASARYFEAEDGHLHIRTDFILDDDENPRNVRVAFVLTDNILFSIHEQDLPVFRLVRLRARLRPGSVRNAKDVLLDLYSTDAEYSADALEEVYENLEEAGKRVLTHDVTDSDAAGVLETIAKEEEGMSSDQIATFEGDCWQHLRNIWFGGVIKQLSKILATILEDDMTKIPSIYCITTDIEDLLRCIEKEFGLNANYYKDTVLCLKSGC